MGVLEYVMNCWHSFLMAIHKYSRFRKAIVLIVFVAILSLLLHHSPNISDKLQEQLGAYHYHKSSRGYSIKPIVYIFPQYYPFPENDRIWGVNFTEWNNVLKATHNSHGLETIRPHESIGYYNGLEFHTRQRQGGFLRDNGFYGAVYHHYWFAGKPVMDSIIQAMLKDGEPNTPFMLNWANEPWTARWDGLDFGEIYIAQDYGSIEDWRTHFEWLLPFFRHPQYIRSEGRVQFIVYNPSHMGYIGPYMFAAWRQWAVEAGLGGMDIIETRWGFEKWNQAIPDAVNEFQPHVAGFDHQRHPFTRRIARVYHRGTLVCWDSTPRHLTDGGGNPQPTCHPKTWQYHIVEMLRQIKSDPNPVGSENFLFINALNEWGEGNALEPSVQFGDGYGTAMKSAIQISEQSHIWPNTLIENELAHSAQIKTVVNQAADVCVLIHTTPWEADDKTFKLAAMLRSLQAQRNQKWRAIVFQIDNDQFAGLTSSVDEIVFRTLDLRIRLVTVPQEVRSAYITDDAGYQVFDWVIENLDQFDPSCASTRYLLITGGANTYEPSAFDSVSTDQRDLVGLNVESRSTIWNHNQLQEGRWEDRCRRLDAPSIKLCIPSAPTSSSIDLSATFVNFARFRAEGHKFAAFTSSHPQRQDAAMIEDLVGRGWDWSKPIGDVCHVMHNPTYTSCRTSGQFWFDSPVFDEMGCYSTQEFQSRFGFDKVDLEYYRENAFCIRYKEEPYLMQTHHSSRDESQ